MPDRPEWEFVCRSCGKASDAVGKTHLDGHNPHKPVPVKEWQYQAWLLHPAVAKYAKELSAHLRGESPWL